MIYLYVKIFLGVKARLRKNLNNKAIDVVQNFTPVTVSEEGTTGTSINVSEFEASTQYNSNQSPKANSHTSSHLKERESNPVKEKIAVCLQKERKAARTLGILIACFILFWFPFSFASFLKVVFGVDTSRSWFLSFAVFGWINSAVNPIIYAIHNKDFKVAFNKMIPKLKPRF